MAAAAATFRLMMVVVLSVAAMIQGRPNSSDLAAGSRTRNTPDILRQHLKQALSKCNSREPPPTHKVLLKDNKAGAVCNDGSAAGYFIRKSYGSKRWVVFLEGGWYCYDKKSCESRWTRLRGFMTSNMWADSRQVSGILSPDPEENPYWWNANHV